MRIIDFIVFYTMANFDKRGLDGLIWGSKLGRAVFLASLNITLFIFICAEILCALLLKIDVFDYSHFKITFFIIGLLNATLLDYIYINRKRYDYIISSDYNTFNLSVNTGVALCFFIYVLSIIGTIIVGGFVGPFLAK